MLLTPRIVRRHELKQQDVESDLHRVAAEPGADGVRRRSLARRTPAPAPLRLPPGAAGRAGTTRARRRARPARCHSLASVPARTPPAPRRPRPQQPLPPQPEAATAADAAAGAISPRRADARGRAATAAPGGLRMLGDDAGPGVPRRRRPVHGADLGERFAARRPGAVTLTFNPAVLKVRSVQEGSFMRQGGVAAQFTQQVDPAGGRVDLTCVRNGDAVGASGSGLVARGDVRARRGRAPRRLRRRAPRRAPAGRR